MEKYYCEHCLIIYEERIICSICGRIAEKKIQIEVHHQDSGKKDR